MIPTDPIYKLAPRPLWAEAESAGRFEGSADDLRDGFIHFSTAAQLRETAAKHFAGITDLVMIAADPAHLGHDLKWETSRGGLVFPHLYAPLSMDAVISVEELPLGTDGRHLFPESFL